MGINELMELNVKKNMILIGELSKKTGITTSAINFYTKKGLLNPPKKLNRTRALYPKSDIKKIKEIKQLKRQGLTLIGIKGIIDGKSNLKINSHQSMKKNMYTVEEFIKYLGIDKKFYSYLIEKKLINKPSETEERIFGKYELFFIYFETVGRLGTGESVQIKAQQVSLFPIIPSISWNFKF